MNTHGNGKPRARVVVGLVLALAACGGGSGAPADASTANDTSAAGDTGCAAVSCSVANDNTCDEYPAPSPTQCPDIPAACANRGGTLASPPACPMPGFVGKCTFSGESPLVTRFYVPADATAMMSFCTGIGGGAWSTTF